MDLWAGPGALIGAGLSAGVFGLFLLPISYLWALLGSPFAIAEFRWPYLLHKAVAAAIAGAAPGYAGKLIQPPSDVNVPPSGQPPLAASESGGCVLSGQLRSLFAKGLAWLPNGEVKFARILSVG